MHADGLMVDTAHALVQGAEVHWPHAGFHGDAHAKTLPSGVAPMEVAIRKQPRHLPERNMTPAPMATGCRQAHPFSLTE